MYYYCSSYDITVVLKNMETVMIIRIVRLQKELRTAMKMIEINSNMED